MTTESHLAGVWESLGREIGAGRQGYIVYPVIEESKLELKAAMSLARAAVAIGRPAEGLTSLRELCATLPPEFDAANLREANDLLSSAGIAGVDGRTAGR